MDRERGEEIVDRVVADVGGAFAAGLAYLGDRLDLFSTLAEIGPCDGARLAEATGLHERYVREWLKAMVAAGYAERDADTDRYFLTEEQAAVLTDEDSPLFAAGAFQFAVPSLLHTERLADVFREGGGIPYAELGDEIPEAIDRLHRPWFDHLLTQQWLPAIPDAEAALRRGVDVLDVGCGFGRSTVVLGEAYPASRIVGLDPHADSLATGRRLASEAALDNVDFIDARVDDLDAETSFGVILAIDCIHDMADPVGTLRGIRRLLDDDGVFVWIEPAGSHRPEENRDPMGKMRATVSPYHCLTVSLAQDGAGLGTIIGEAGARALADSAGFSDLERVSIDPPVQLVFALRR